MGLTDDLQERMWEHKQGVYDGFTRKYEVNRLMYFETFTDAAAAAAREKQIKGYRREKKIALFEKSSPGWRDLTEELLVLL